LLFKSIVELCVYGENIERFLNICAHHNINIYDVTKTEDKCYLKILASDFFHLKGIVKKSNIKLKIHQKQGLFFHLKRQSKRKTFVISSCICLLLLWIASHFLWNIQITGNHTISNDMLTDYLRENGIYYGMPLSQIPIYELKTNLRNTYDEVTWVSIYLDGTILRISLKENDSVKPKINKNTSYTNLVADENGIVESVLVRQGTSMVKAGDSVSQNDILISGKIDIMADDYTIKESKYCEADGDIYLIYHHPIEESVSLEYLVKEYTGNIIQRKELFYQNTPLKFPHLKIPYTKYDAITETLDQPILKVLSIPLTIKQITFREYHITKRKYDHLEAEKLLNEKLDKIILSLEEKGVQIIEKNVKISTNSAYMYLTGDLTVRSLCSRLQTMEENE